MDVAIIVSAVKVVRTATNNKYIPIVVLSAFSLRYVYSIRRTQLNHTSCTANNCSTCNCVGASVLDGFRLLVFSQPE